MLDGTDRKVVESVRKAQRITIVAISSDGTEMQLTFDERRQGDISKLRHDVAVSLQDYYNRKIHR